MNKNAGLTTSAIILIIVFMAGAFVAVKMLSDTDKSLINDCKYTCDKLDMTYYDVGTNLNIVVDGIKDEVLPSDADKYCWCTDEEDGLERTKRVEVEHVK